MEFESVVQSPSLYYEVRSGFNKKRMVEISSLTFSSFSSARKFPMQQLASHGGMSIHQRLMYARQSPKRGELKQNKKESWKKRLLASSQKRHEQDKHGW